MTYEEELSDPTTLAPDEAFDVLGNETRIEILRVLGRADVPLTFSELYDQVEYDTTANFNYHLDKLEGHFVRKTDDGYELRQAGRRVVQAVLSGAVTDAPVLDRTRIDQVCPHCDAPIEVRYHQERVEMFCTECAGTWRQEDSALQGYIGCLSLPPAGLQGRTTEEAFRAAWTWANLRIFAIASGICPSCSAALEQEVDVCEDHDADDDVCHQCDRRYAVQFRFQCTNCVFDGEATFSVALTATTELLAFLTAHGLNPISPIRTSKLEEVHNDYDEAVRSTDPFEAAFTFTIDGDELTLTVDDDLSVIDAKERQASEPVR